MADVTVTLTQEESNYIHWMLNNLATDTHDRYNKLRQAVKATGSLDGQFGGAIKNTDELMLEGLEVAVEVYDELAGKFPVEEI